MFFTLVSVLISLPIITHAEVINNNGIVISDEEYENFLKLHNEAYIMNMDEDKYERLLELDYDDIRTETKYVISTYNPNLELTTNQEVTEAEYNAFTILEGAQLNMGNVASPNLNDGFAQTETTAKKLTMTIAGGSYWNYATLALHWKYMPATRVYDVIGFRADGLSVRNGSQEGTQQYYKNGSWTVINYSWNGTNIKKLDNGFGISMNLIDDTSITALELDIECDVAETASAGTLFGSYQHAVSSLTLAQSQSYTLGGALGSVFTFPSNISAKYDGMSGVRVDF